MKELNKLAAIADELDEQGLTQAADIITDVMRRIAQSTHQDVVNMAPSLNSVGQYDENAWKQAFADKYHRFVQLANSAKDAHASKDINPTLVQGLYNEMVYMASNYLKDDPDVFNAMKWVAPTYKGLFS